jgi:hypothetical protein
MLPIDDRLVDVLVDTIPIGIDKSVYETTEFVLSEFIKNPINQYISEVAQDIYTQLEDAPNEIGMRVKIYVRLTLEDAIAIKLYKWPD